jgi:hypothetical protein
MWSSFRLWLGDGVREVLENKKRAKAKKKAARKAKCRKIFGLKPKPPKEPLEEEQQVLGKVVLVEMRKQGLFTRKFEWEVDGVQYRWSGTRMFATGRMKGVKGWTHDLKVSLLEIGVLRPDLVDVAPADSRCFHSWFENLIMLLLRPLKKVVGHLIPDQ